MPAKWSPSSAEELALMPRPASNPSRTAQPPRRQIPRQQRITCCYPTRLPLRSLCLHRVFPNFAAAANIPLAKSGKQSPDPLGRYNASHFLGLVGRRIGAGHCCSSVDHALRSNRSLGRKRRPHILENFHAFFFLNPAGRSIIGSIVQAAATRSISGRNRKPRMNPSQLLLRLDLTQQDPAVRSSS